VRQLPTLCDLIELLHDGQTGVLDFSIIFKAACLCDGLFEGLKDGGALEIHADDDDIVFFTAPTC
jgi:hypothetical protein